MKGNPILIARREFLQGAACAVLSTGLAWSTWEGPFANQRGSRISYYCDGELHVSLPGKSEIQRLTTGHWDFKPSWSMTDDRLVFFRRLINDPDVGKWITAICTIKADGSGFHQLSSGHFTDFNPTWSRDGKNTPLWNRKTSAGRYRVMASKVGGAPGEEIALTGEGYSSWVHSSLRDGRLLVSSAPPQQARGYFLMSAGDVPGFERIEGELLQKGSMDRVSISPSETKVCFEYQQGFESRGMAGRTLYVAEFDARRRLITNAQAIANKEGKPHWIAYPRWVDGEEAIVYHSGESGTNQLYVYRLQDSSTRKVSMSPNADYRYPHGEGAPC